MDISDLLIFTLEEFRDSTTTTDVDYMIDLLENLDLEEALLQFNMDELEVLYDAVELFTDIYQDEVIRRQAQRCIEREINQRRLELR